MPQQLVSNFVKTTLRAPATALDTSLQLAVGAGAFFDIPSGDWCYITVTHGTVAEIMKYTSVGTPVDDIIPVERAQDNTTAQEFPVGACVTEGWNVAQVIGLIDQEIANTPTPDDTIALPDPDSVPVDTPDPGIIYAINKYTGQLWYYRQTPTTEWILVTSNGVEQTLVDPVAAPPVGTVWAFNSTSATLWFWNGSLWARVGGTSGGIVEINSRQYLSIPIGIAIGPGQNAFHDWGIVLNPVIAYQSNPAVPSIISVPTSGPNTGRVVFSHDCIMSMYAAASGTYDGSGNFFGQILLAHTAGDTVYGTTAYIPDASLVVSVFMVADSGPVRVAAGDAWDADLIISVLNQLTISQAVITVTVYAIL